MRWSVSALLVAVLTLGVTVVAASPAQAASPQAGTAAGDAADGATASPTPVAKVEASATASPAATPTVTPSSDATSEPEAAATPTPSAKPASAEPSASPTAEEEASAGATATPTAREGEPTASADSDSRPTIVSDLADYPPGGTVTLTGTGWQPGEVVTIVVNDTGGLSWSLTEKVVADADGRITLTFNLPDYWVPDYDVTATGTVSGTATTTFTDAATGGSWVYWLTADPASGQSLSAGAGITYTLSARQSGTGTVSGAAVVLDLDLSGLPGGQVTFTSSGSGSVSVTGSTLTWSAPNLTSSTTAVTRTITATFTATAPGSVTATATDNNDPSGSVRTGYTDTATHSLTAGALNCGYGYVYSILANGEVYRIGPQATGADRTLVIPGPSGSSGANALGIGADGATAYAIERTGSIAQNVGSVYRYNASTGTWVAIANSGFTTGLSNSIVAGAVDLSTGLYVYGVFASRGTTYSMRLYTYNPATNTHTAIGSVPFGMWSTTLNGDFAFDSAGNLTIVASTTPSGSSMSVQRGTVSSADFQAAVAAASSTRSIAVTLGTRTTVTSAAAFNGVAFDADGTMYAATTTTVASYNSSWVSTGTKSTALSNSNDLASCSSPPSLVLQKNVAARSSASDQFTLTVAQGSTAIATATTTGAATGVQSQFADAENLTAAATYNIAESMASGSSSPMSSYASSWQCVNSGTTLASGTGTSGSVTIPALVRGQLGSNVVCTFTNTPVRTVTVRKTWVNGVNGDKADLVINNATTTPGKATSTSNGNLGSWTDTGNVATATPTPGSSVSVAEAMQSANKGTYTPGLACVDGNSAAVSVSSGTFTMPNSNVTCTFTNDGVRPTIALWKTTVGAAGGQFSFALTNTVQAGGTVTTTAADTRTQVDGNTSAAGIQPFTVANFGTAVTVAEPVGSMPAGWTLAGATCKSGTETVGSLTGTTYTIPASALTAGAVITCDFTNRPIVGTVTWSKVDAGSTTTLLAGSEWTLTGPSYPSGTIVADCVAASVAACTGLDKDPAAGAFSVASLAYGSYTLVERIAPVGFQLDTTPRPFAIATDGQSVSLGAITNKRSNVPSLPLTGGTSADAFLFTGAALFAAAGIGGWLHRRRLLRSS